MNRRKVLSIICLGSLPSLSGCITAPGSNGGLLELYEESAPPHSTVVDSTDPRVQDIDSLQKGFQKLTSDDRTVAEVVVSEGEYDSVAQALSALPWYDRADHEGEYLSGIYFRFNGTETAVVLTPFCTDSLLTSASSERGEYGWGGCYDREE